MLSFHPTLITLAPRIHTVPAMQNTPAKTFTPVQLPFSLSNIAPAMGEVVNAPTLLNKNTSPVLNPISFMGEICATRVAIRDTYAPEKKPNKTAKAMCPLSVCDPRGSQRARSRTPVMKAAAMKMLNLPRRSARNPVVRRPKRLR